MIIDAGELDFSQKTNVIFLYNQLTRRYGSRSEEVQDDEDDEDDDKNDNDDEDEEEQTYMLVTIR